MVRPVLGLRIVFAGKPVDDGWIVGGKEHLDLRDLSGAVYGLQERLAGVDVIIDVGDLRPGFEPDRVPEISEALALARSVTVQGSDRSCASWLREQLQLAAA